jgi:hypothetical protein
MGLGDDRPALYAPLSSTTAAGSSQSLIKIVPDTAAWWDASSPEGLLGPGDTPTTAWDGFGTALIDLTGGSNDLVPFYNPTSFDLPQNRHISRAY